MTATGGDLDRAHNTGMGDAEVTIPAPAAGTIPAPATGTIPAPANGTIPAPAFQDAASITASSLSS